MAASAVDITKVLKTLKAPKNPAKADSGRLPSAFSFTIDGDRVCAVTVDSVRATYADLALAYSLQLLDDRDLWLVLPKNTEFPTLRRAAWLSPKIRVWTIDEAGELREHPIPARPEERIRWRDVAVRVGVAGLGDRAEWITPLLDWARAAPDVVDTSRESYVDFQCDGRSILKITPAVDHLDVRAGTDWKKPDANKPKAECLKVTGPLRSEEIHRLVGAASRSAAARLSREDREHEEHRFQARLRPHDLHLSDWRREMPAVRPAPGGSGPFGRAKNGARGFIDFLGCDGKRLHVVETKIGPDPMLVLQGLDYWTWTTGQRDRLAVVFAMNNTEPDVEIDFVVKRKAPSAALVGAFTKSQAEALDPGIRWRFHVVEWGSDDDPSVEHCPEKSVPDP